MYQFVNGNLPDIFKGLFVKNIDINLHQYNARNADELYVPYARLDVSQFSHDKIVKCTSKLHKGITSLHMFKQNIRNHLINDKF